MTIKKLSDYTNKSTIIEDKVITRLTSYSSERLELLINKLELNSNFNILRNFNLLPGNNIKVDKINNNKDLVISLDYVKEDINLLNLPIAIKDKYYEAQILTEINPDNYKVNNINNLPAGLNLNSENNTIYGIIRATGVFILELTILNKITNNIINKTIKLTVNSIYIIVDLPRWYAGIEYSGQVTCFLGEEPYKYYIDNLPSGLTINENTGIISGISNLNAYGSRNLNIKVIDNSGFIFEDIKTLILDEIYVINIKNTEVDHFQNLLLEYQLEAENGFGPYVWSISGLPTGFNLNRNTGIITGISSEILDTTIEITVTDKYNVSSTKVIPFVVETGFPIDHSLWQLSTKAANNFTFSYDSNNKYHLFTVQASAHTGGDYVFPLGNIQNIKEIFVSFDHNYYGIEYDNINTNGSDGFGLINNNNVRNSYYYSLMALSNAFYVSAYNNYINIPSTLIESNWQKIEFYYNFVNNTRYTKRDGVTTSEVTSNGLGSGQYGHLI
jgi:hypothetical protein